MSEEKTYWELLRDPRWQRVRLQVMERENFRCQECGSAEQTLNVHHCYYRKGLKPWEYPIGTLRCLCEACHKTAHETLDLLKQVVSEGNYKTLWRICAYAHALIRIAAGGKLVFAGGLDECTQGVADAFGLTVEEIGALTDQKGYIRVTDALRRRDDLHGNPAGHGRHTA